MSREREGARERETPSWLRLRSFGAKGRVCQSEGEKVREGRTRVKDNSLEE